MVESAHIYCGKCHREIDDNEDAFEWLFEVYCRCCAVHLHGMTGEIAQRYFANSDRRFRIAQDWELRGQTRRLSFLNDLLKQERTASKLMILTSHPRDSMYPQKLKYIIYQRREPESKKTEFLAQMKPSKELVSWYDLERKKVSQ